jgi:hypothetical protein
VYVSLNVNMYGYCSRSGRHRCISLAGESEHERHERPRRLSETKTAITDLSATPITIVKLTAAMVTSTSTPGSREIEV